MIIGLGSDLIDIRRVEKSIERFGDRFTHRCFTEIERKKSDGRKNRAASYAKRFAAKEAAAKALGTGIGRGVSFQHISISNNADGAPRLALTGYAGELAASMGVSHMWLSITDEQAYAAATVILEQQ